MERHSRKTARRPRSCGTVVEIMSGTSLPLESPPSPDYRRGYSRQARTRTTPSPLPSLPRALNFPYACRVLLAGTPDCASRHQANDGHPSPSTSDRADARHAGGGDPVRPLSLRAEMGRIQGPRFPWQQRRLSAEPRLASSRPLLPRAPRRAHRVSSRQLRARWRDRHRDGRRPRLRCTSAAPPSSGLARPEARERNALFLRGIRCPRDRQAQPDGRTAGSAARGPRKAAGRSETARVPDAGHARPRNSARLAHALRRRGPRRRGSETGASSGRTSSSG